MVAQNGPDRGQRRLGRCGLPQLFGECSIGVAYCIGDCHSHSLRAQTSRYDSDHPAPVHETQRNLGGEGTLADTTHPDDRGAGASDGVTQQPKQFAPLASAADEIVDRQLR